MTGALVPALTGCGWFGAHDMSTHGPDTVSTASPGPGGVQVVQVTGDERMRFSPNVVRAHRGRLRIVLSVTGETPHDLAVPKLDATTGMVQKGRSGSVEVDLRHSGRYEFVCTYHEQHGMTGVIEVS